MKFRKSLLSVLILSVAVLSLAVLPAAGRAKAETADPYSDQYRPELSYTPARNWNNDPNGLLFDGEKYHLYYQYATTGNRWDTMHWGHAVSDDLIAWTEKEVAVYPNMPGWDNYNSAKPAGPIFSGSAVYVSEEDIAEGKGAFMGSGYYAIFTQPDASNPRVGDQRQSIAFSSDGDSYEIIEEIIPNEYPTAPDGSGAAVRGDFRDPKVFWHDGIEKWMMVVGGGEVVQFTSDDLENWTYLGTTGLWGECPDLFKLPDPSGEGETWVMLLSPEEKPQSHEYNGTTRDTHKYPNEFYVPGDCDGNGLFTRRAGVELKQFSFGFDSYAAATFNGTDNRRIGISWSANWKTVKDYANKYGGGLRENWNGGMTMLYELSLIEKNGELFLAKNPLPEYDGLLGDVKADKTDITLGSDNALGGVTSTLALVELTLDADGAAANAVTLKVNVSDYEETVIGYDLATGTLSVDRSKSSLAARNTGRINEIYSAKVDKNADGKVKIRVFVDRSGLTVFGGEGEASAAITTFPSLASNRFELTADGEITASVKVTELNGIHGAEHDNAANAYEGFYLSAKDEKLATGKTLPVLAGSTGASFDPEAVSYAVTEGDAVSVDKGTEKGSAVVTAVKPGKAIVTATYGTVTREFTVTVTDGTVDSELEFNHTYAGEWYVDNGIIGSSRADHENKAEPDDAFVFTSEKYSDFTFTADVTVTKENTVAAGLVFAVTDDRYNFYCANYDYGGKIVKLWKSGGESLAEYPLSLRPGDTVRYGVTVIGNRITVSVNGTAVISIRDSSYSGGYLGLNVFSGAARFDGITLEREFSAANPPVVTVGEGKFMLRNDTAKTYLKDSDYTVENGEFKLTDAYLNSLVFGKTYAFTFTFENGETKSFGFRKLASAEVFDAYRTFTSSESLAVAIDAGDAAVTGVTLDGREVEFTFDRGRVILADSFKDGLTDGVHSLKILTDRGALEYGFRFKVIPPEPVDRTGMIVSIVSAALVGCAVLGFMIYWIIAGKRRINR